MNKPQCPKCHIDLTKQKNNGIFSFECETCFGSAYTLAVLKRKVEKIAISQMWTHALRAPINKSMSCPFCKSKMKSVHLPDIEFPVLDVCLTCQSIWLDHGEIYDLPKNQIENIGADSRLNKNNKNIDDLNKDLRTSEIRKQIAIAEVMLMKEKYKNSSAASVSSAPSGYKYFMTIVGLPVEETTDQHRNFPIVTFGLILFSTIIYFVGLRDLFVIKSLEVSSNSNIFGRFIFSIPSLFAHSSFFQFAYNMIYLNVFGDNVEDELGPKAYILMIILSSFVGSQTFFYLYPGNEGSVIGPTGVIGGVLAYYTYRFPMRKFIIAKYDSFLSVNAFVFVIFHVLFQIFVLTSIEYSTYHRAIHNSMNSISRSLNYSNLAFYHFFELFGGAIVGLFFAIYYAQTLKEKNKK